MPQAQCDLCTPLVLWEKEATAGLNLLPWWGDAAHEGHRRSPITYRSVEHLEAAACHSKACSQEQGVCVS